MVREQAKNCTIEKQRGKILRITIENLRHDHGTNITKHMDLFKKLITQISQNETLQPPTEEQRSN
jgi:hypothetical protein